MKKLLWSGYHKLKNTSIISAVESVLKINFPCDYIACVKKYNNGSPSPNTIDISGEEDTLNNLLNVDPGAEHNILEICLDIKNRLPDNVYPFGRDPFGNFYCFDYSKGPSPTIVFWDHEESFSKKKAKTIEICKSFTEFLNLLHEPEDIDDDDEED